VLFELKKLEGFGGAGMQLSGAKAVQNQHNKKTT
jgi:hypothetical protein